MSSTPTSNTPRSGPQPARNAPCPCGSGRKYKQCCGRNGGLSDEEALAERRGRQLLQTCREAQQAVFRETKKIVDRDTFIAANEAWFGAAGIEYTDPVSVPIQELFLEWLVHQYELDGPADGDGPRTVVAHYLARRRPVPARRRYLEASLREPLSYWEVEEVGPGPWVRLSDRFLPRSVRVYDRSISQSVHEGAVLFGYFVEDGDIAVIAVVAEMPIVGRHLALVDELAERIEGQVETPEDLFRLWPDLLATYGQYLQAMEAPAMPRIYTPDGDPLEITTLRYTVVGGDGGVLAETLRDAADFAVDDQRAAESDADEEVHAVWFGVGGREESGTSLHGSLHFDDEHLVAELMSAKRAVALRERLMELFGERLRFVSSQSKGIEEALFDDASRQPKPPPAAGLELDPDNLPAEILDVMRQRFLAWADENVPALGGLTPREAMESEVGRVRVAELVDDWERMGRGQAPMPGADFAALRAELGLDEEG